MNEKPKYGKETSFYLQDRIEEEMMNTIDKYPNSYQSRSHFINVAIRREIDYRKEQKWRNV